MNTDDDHWPARKLFGMPQQADQVLPPPATAGELLARYQQGERNFKEAQLEGAVMTGADLTGADLSGACLRGAQLDGAVLVRTGLIDADLRGAALSGARFTGTTTDEQDSRPSTWVRAYLAGASLAGATMCSVDLRGAMLDRADLSAADLSSANLHNASLRSANLSSADLFRALLAGANLLDVETDNRTNFAEAVLDHASVRAHTVVDIESLTQRQKMRLDIHDSLADLRRGYSGIWLWIHIVALVLFLSPYIAFVVRATLATAISARIPDSASPLGVELLWYVLSAGSREHQFSWWSLLFVCGVGYNVLRAAMLYKTQVLALQHETTGLPLTYVLEHDAWWYRAYWLTTILFWVNLFVVAWHVWLALSEPVVLTPVR